MHKHGLIQNTKVLEMFQKHAGFAVKIEVGELWFLDVSGLARFIHVQISGLACRPCYLPM
jgi:hypothetical protein